MHKPIMMDQHRKGEMSLVGNYINNELTAVMPGKMRCYAPSDIREGYE